MTRTSASHPLQVATLALPEGGGCIGITFCPGKCDLKAHGGPWMRDLAPDLGAIRAWGANALVTLLDDHEFETLHVRDLGDRVEAAGLDWHHLPIPDMAAPGWQFERRWVYSGARLRRLLRRGGRVLIHCRAGLGRAGTIAARLLVELGVPTAEAVSQVRRVRPGAIQTADQERHVQQVRLIAAGQDEGASRRLASLIGGALGDAFGYGVAGETLAAIRKRHGPAGVREPEYQRNRLVVSDETQLTLFTLEGLTRAMQMPGAGDERLLAELRLSYLDWLASQESSGAEGGHATRLLKHAALHVRRNPSTTCLRALRAQKAVAAAPAGDCGHGGGVLRTTPLAFMPDMTAQRAFELGVGAAQLTHGEPHCHLPAGILTATVHGVLAGMPLQNAMLQAGSLARVLDAEGRVIGRLDAAVEASVQPYRNQLPESLGGERKPDVALNAGFYAASRSQDFREVMAIAANQDGDSDVAACVAGQLFGALQGIESLPHTWVRRLDVLDALCDAADWALPLWRRAAESGNQSGVR